MSDHENDKPAAAPTLAELNAHLFATMLPETHTIEPAEDEQADTEPKKPAKGKASTNEK
jgi:hypothetical protein